MRVADRRLFAAIVLCALLVTVAYQHSEPFQLNLSALDNPLIEGFHAPEHSRNGALRWTSAHVAVRLPNLWPQQPVRINLQLSAPRPDNVPVPVALNANGQPIATLTLTSTNSVLTFDLDPNVLGASGNLYLTLDAPPWAPPNDLRTLGVLVRALDVTPTGRPPFMPALPLLLTTCAFVAASYIWLRRLGVGAPFAFGINLLVSAAVFALLWDARVLIALVNARVLFWLVVAFALAELTIALGHFRDDMRAMRVTALLFLAAFGVRMIFAHAPGDADNFTAFKMMIAQATTHGLGSIYDLDPVVGAYPPLHHYDMALVGWLYRTFVSPEFDVASSRLNFLMKMPTIVLDMLIVVVVMVYAARRRDTRTALLVGAAYAFNPSIIYTTAYNGQLGDPLYALFVTLAVVSLVGEHAAWLGAATMLAVLTKPQASAFLPFLAIAALRHLRVQNIPRTVVTGGATTLVVLMPFVFAGTIGDMIRTVSTTIGHGPRISANAFNIWWLLGWGNAWNISDTQLWFSVPYRMLGLLLFFVVAYGLAAWKLWTTSGSRSLLMLAAFVGFAFFMLPTEIHENYLFPTIPLLALLVVHEWRAWWLLVSLSATWFVNLLTTDAGIVDGLNVAQPVLFPLQVFCTLINIGALLVMARWVLQLRAESEPVP